MKRHPLVRSLLLLGVMWLLALPVSAHGYLVRSIPADRSQLERSPTRLQYWFSEQLEPRFSRLTLRDSAGQIIAEGGVDENNRNLMSLRLPPNALADGVYVVELAPAFASDGHVSLSTNVFTVGAASGLVDSQAASQLPLLLEVVWKVLLLSGTHLLFGVTMLYVYVLRPAWGSSKHPAGGLPPRVMNRLYALIGVGLGLAIIGNVVALVQQSAVFFNTSIAQVLESGLWQVVRIGSRFGDVWNVRMFFLIVMAGLMAASLYYRTRYPETVRAFWVAGTWCMALVLGANAIISHAAGSLVMPWVALSMHWLHTLASAFWVGGLAALALVLPVALQPYEGDARRQVILTAMRRYSLLVVGALAVVVTSGLYNSSNWFYSADDLTTVYGGTLALKALLVAILIGVGALHHLALRPQLAEQLRVDRWPLIRQAGHFHATLNAETVLAACVLVAAGALSSTPVPVPDFLDRRLPPNTQTVQVDGWVVTATIAPGGTGINTVDVSVTQASDSASRDDLRVTLQLSDPERDVRGLIHSAEPLGEGLYSAFLDDIDMAGRWWSSVDLRTEDGRRLRAAFAWNISEEANVILSLPPSLWTVLLGFVVCAALGYVLYPSAKALYARLNLTPQSVLTASIAIGISVFLIGFAIVSVEQQRLAQATSLLPPPRVVNPTLPTQDSLERGEQLYYQRCVIWQTVTDFRAFMNQVDRLRDGDIYDAIRSGWRNMPACNGDFTEDDIWDVVNFVRVLQYQFRRDL